ncbi:MAG: hypothetical protein IH587_02350 [Anaerolineae bacterium]|nr:hypothetical protein [Anaerolineae bacterium]
MTTNTSKNTEIPPQPKIRAKENVKLWAYLDITNPLVAWEVAIGRICSADDPSRESYGTSLWFHTLMRKFSKEGLGRRFLNELLLEQTRLQHYPAAVSRLRGVYFFETEEATISAVDRWRIPKNRRFISSVNFSANMLTRVDSEWITWNLLSEDHSWMPKYWAGETFGIAPLTEVLASGIGLVQNMEVRNAAVKWVYENWPLSTPLLSMAACSAKEAQALDVPEFETFGLISPILTAKNGVIQGTYSINMRALLSQPEKIIMALDACLARNECLPCIMESDRDQFRLPDLSDLHFEIHSTKAAETLTAVHRSSL